MFPNAAIGHKRNAQGHTLFHFCFYDVDKLLFFGLVQIKNQLVVHLQNHSAVQFFLGYLMGNPNHGDFNHVGGAALNGGVDGVSLCKAPQRAVLCMNVGEVPSSVKGGGDISKLFGTFNLVLYVLFYFGISGKVVFNEGFRACGRLS